MKNKRTTDYIIIGGGIIGCSTAYNLANQGAKSVIVLEKGETGNGDLFDEKNFIYCKNKYGNTMHLVTADGGFDFSANYNEQETTLNIELKLSYRFWVWDNELIEVYQVGKSKNKKL